MIQPVRCLVLLEGQIDLPLLGIGVGGEQLGGCRVGHDPQGGGGFFHRVADDGAYVRWQAIPELLIDDHGIS